MTDEETPLLAPEAEAGSVSTTRTPIPWKPVLTLLLLNSAAPLAFELIFPFINQMLVELEIVKDVERVGFYSGVIESVFSVMSLITILPTSYASDRIGRKPVILFGMIGLALSTICFGLSRSYFTLILSRCLGGALGGTWTAIRVMIAEMTDRSNQSIAFTGLGISFRTGQIIGLPLGGYLSHPERLNPVIFGGPFWAAYPFALPCFVGAGVTIIAVILGLVFIEETNPQHKKTVSREDITVPAGFAEDPVVPSMFAEGNSSEEHSRPKSTSPPPSVVSALTKPVLAVLISNIFMCLLSELLFSVYPLFAFTPLPLGGLGLSEAAIGTHLSIRAFLHIAVMFAFPPLHRWTGRESAVRIYQFSMALWPICVGFYPLLSWMARTGRGGGVGGTGFNAVVGLFFVVWSFANFGWNASSMLVNDAAPSASALATIAGVFQMSIILPQAIAPAGATSLFALSIRNTHILGGKLVWVALSLLGFGAALQSLTLREPEHDWRAEEARKSKANRQGEE